MSGSIETAVTPVAGAPPASSISLASISGYPPDSSIVQSNADGSSTTTVTGPTGAVVSTSTTLPNLTTIQTNPDGSITTTVTGASGRIISSQTTLSLVGVPASTTGAAPNAVNGGSAASLGLVNLNA